MCSVILEEHLLEPILTCPLHPQEGMCDVFHSIIGHHNDVVDTGIVHQEEVVIVAEDKQVLGTSNGVKGRTGLDQEVEKEGLEQEVEKEDTDHRAKKESIDQEVEKGEKTENGDLDQEAMEELEVEIGQDQGVKIEDPDQGVEIKGLDQGVEIGQDQGVEREDQGLEINGLD